MLIRKKHIYLKKLIWDKAPMTPKYALEIINEKLKELKESNKLFGGVIMLLDGDFRQVLPIKSSGTGPEIVDLSLKRNKLWKHFTVIKLTKNMRADLFVKDIC